MCICIYIYIYYIYWAPRAIYSVQAVKTAHLLITFSFSLPPETSKSQAGMRQLWVILKHSHQDPEILHAIGPLGMILSLRLLIHMNPCPKVWFSVLPLPANHVCGLRYWGWLMWQFCLAEYHIESGRWDGRDWGPKFSWSSHKPCLSLDDMSLISYCYFHNSCRNQLNISGHIQPVYKNHWLDHEFETKSNLCRFAKDLTSMINIMPSHSNFNSQGFWNDGCWCFQKLWSHIRENRALLGAFFWS